jgi:hypothetical protein
VAYEVFEIELYREAEPILLGMLRKGTLPRIAQKQCRSQGWKFRSFPSLEAPGARPTKTPCRTRPRRSRIAP